MYEMEIKLALVITIIGVLVGLHNSKRISPKYKFMGGLVVCFGMFIYSADELVALVQLAL